MLPGIYCTSQGESEREHARKGGTDVLQNSCQYHRFMRGFDIPIAAWQYCPLCRGRERRWADGDSARFWDLPPHDESPHESLREDEKITEHSAARLGKMLAPGLAKGFKILHGQYGDLSPPRERKFDANRASATQQRTPSVPRMINFSDARPPSHQGRLSSVPGLQRFRDRGLLSSDEVSDLKGLASRGRLRSAEGVVPRSIDYEGGKREGGGTMTSAGSATERSAGWEDPTASGAREHGENGDWGHRGEERARQHRGQDRDLPTLSLPLERAKQLAAASPASKTLGAEPRAAAPVDLERRTVACRTQSPKPAADQDTPRTPSLGDLALEERDEWDYN